MQAHTENRARGEPERGDKPGVLPGREQVERPPDKQQKPHDRQKPEQSFIREHRWSLLIGGAILVAALIGVGLWWLSVRDYETTDDAFIDTRTVPISSQVAGAITSVPVTDNQLVQAGAVLVTIDRRDYQAKLDQAKAQVDQAVANQANVTAQLDAQQSTIQQALKNVAQSQAALVFAQQEDQRAKELLQRGAGTQQNAQRTASTQQQDQAALASAQAAAVAAQKQNEVLRAQAQIAQAQLESAKATRDQADTDLARTTIHASVAGRIAKLTAAKGAYATVGQALMMLVPRDVWITANFKETQLTDMRPGQPVTLRIDAYPGRDFKGHVDSIQSGSGTAFSLLPTENATGNFVKVVQRVPVKIVLNAEPDALLGPGMSVVPWVKVR